MIRLAPVLETDRNLLWNLVQKYLYEMSNYYEDPFDNVGNYCYEHFEEYFSDPKRTAYLLYIENTLIGFAMLHPYSCLGRTPDFTMAEFTIFPAFRRRHLAVEAVNTILKKHPGQWEIKYNEKNLAAKRLWNNVASAYNPETVHLNDEETVLCFTRETN